MTNENGRSMVEMLGVLAIIGVLSVGGIAGYTMAMNKYRANENLATGSQCVILAQSDNAGEGIDVNDSVDCEDKYDLDVRHGVTMRVKHTSANCYTLMLKGVSTDVKNAMENTFSETNCKPYKLDFTLS